MAAEGTENGAAETAEDTEPGSRFEARGRPPFESPAPLAARLESRAQFGVFSVFGGNAFSGFRGPAAHHED